MRCSGLVMPRATNIETASVIRQHQRGGHQRTLGRSPGLRLEIVDIDAGADHPVPGSKADHVGQLRLRLVEARLRPLVGNEARAVLPDDFDEIDEQGLAVRILVGREIVAVHLRLDRMHHHARLHVVDPEIIVVAVSQRREPRHRPLLRVGDRDVALLCRGVLFLDDAERQIRRDASVRSASAAGGSMPVRAELSTPIPSNPRKLRPIRA